MEELINTLQRFSKCYEGDPEGLNSDFSAITGFSFEELCDRLQDEIDGLEALEADEL